MGVRESIIAIIKDYTSEDAVVEGDISLIDDLEMDSMQLIEVLTAIEEKFGLTFEDGEKMLDMVDHLEELIQYVEQKFVGKE